MILALPHEIVSINPMTGRLYWRCTGLGDDVVASPMIADDRLVAAAADGSVVAMQLPTTQSGDVTSSSRLWRRPATDPGHQATGLIVGDHVFLPDDEGNLACVVVDTGEVVWQREIGADGNASLLAAEGRLYYTDGEGVIHVLRAGPQFEHLRSNVLIQGDPVAATPTFDRSQIFIRTRTHLYCIGVQR